MKRTVVQQLRYVPTAMLGSAHRCNTKGKSASALRRQLAAVNKEFDQLIAAAMKSDDERRAQFTDVQKAFEVATAENNRLTIELDLVRAELRSCARHYAMEIERHRQDVNELAGLLRRQTYAPGDDPFVDTSARPLSQTSRVK